MSPTIAVTNELRALRRPDESYSDVINRCERAAPSRLFVCSFERGGGLDILNAEGNRW
jgi:hypothetical protein